MGGFSAVLKRLDDYSPIPRLVSICIVHCASQCKRPNLDKLSILLALFKRGEWDGIGVI